MLAKDEKDLLTMPSTSSHRDTPPSISNAEWEVMKTLWDRGPMAARDVYAALPAGHRWAYRTVKTLLSRLVAKGTLDYEQVGNSYRYHAVYTREEMVREKVRGFVDRVLDGSLSPLLAHFIEEGGLSDEEVARLQDLLERTDPEDGGAGKRRGRDGRT